MVTTARHHIVTDRIVFTYCPEQWPEGCVTGYRDDRDGIALEHVVAFAPGIMMPMLRCAIQAAWDLGAQHITICLPHTFPLTPRLALVAQRCGFYCYARDWERAFWIRYRP